MLKGMEWRVGQGYDIHPLIEGRPLYIGGVHIEHEAGLLGHSDADVLLHAVTDALLGAAGHGDIGTHFSPSDERWRDAASIRFLQEAFNLLRVDGWAPINVDATVIAERPRLAPYTSQMRDVMADALGLERSCVSIKATTNERIGAIGREEGIAALAVALIQRT